jgi:hypothetical protein
MVAAKCTAMTIDAANRPDEAAPYGNRYVRRLPKPT